ncbi:unnamed protein product [Durusdinium trenchii]|uniref:Uncharacterized protein n=1 Tax=Durusdinium trenchii TaxID=1381693 RepID=A0ABP0S3H5_9DINO
MAALPTTTVGLPTTTVGATVVHPAATSYTASLPTSNWIQPALPTIPATAQPAAGAPLPTIAMPVSSLPTTVPQPQYTYTTPTVASQSYPSAYLGPMAPSQGPLAVPIPTVPLQPMPSQPVNAGNTVPQPSAGASGRPASTSIVSHVTGAAATPTNAPVPVPSGSPVAMPTQSFLAVGPTISQGSGKVEALPTRAAIPQGLGEASENLDEATVPTQSLKNVPKSSRKTKKNRRRWICC